VIDYSLVHAVGESNRSVFRSTLLYLHVPLMLDETVIINHFLKKNGTVETLVILLLLNNYRIYMFS
jgi:hypothetical protein